MQAAATGNRDAEKVLEGRREDSMLGSLNKDIAKVSGVADPSVHTAMSMSSPSDKLAFTRRDRRSIYEIPDTP
jgi:hypothetical protein